MLQMVRKKVSIQGIQNRSSQDSRSVGRFAMLDRIPVPPILILIGSMTVDSGPMLRAVHLPS